MTASIHKLTAGSGYDYLTRQVAAMDATEKGHTSLASYYTEKGETPGVWIGSGMAGIDGLDAGDVVTGEQMKALFAYGLHPLAEQRVAAIDGTPTAAQVKVAERLGTPFKVYDADVPPFQIEVARRIEDLNVAVGQPRDSAVRLADRAKIRTEVAVESFVREYGREPVDAREVAATIAKLSRPRTTAVAGFDLTFSPVKSVSTLWAIADPSTAATIERAHNAAVKDALEFLESDALYTREGTNGVRQVDTRGLVATAFTHRDSRAGDPDLHTHVAIANKVQTLDGKWLAIDGRPLFKAIVAISESYNTALEKHLSMSLGVRFAVRPGGDPRKRPVREIVGVPAELNERWSTRRASIEQRRAVLAAEFQTAHGRPPTPVEAIQLAQQATLETRDAKHEPRTITQQREVWRREAVAVLGGENAVDAVAGTARMATGRPAARVTAGWIDKTAERILVEVSARRATWQPGHLMAEAQRQLRDADLAPGQVRHVARLLVDAAIGRSVVLRTDRDPIEVPDALRRRDGSSVYRVAGSDLYTSTAVLDAEQAIVAAAGRVDGRRVPVEEVELAVMESAANGVTLNAGQAALVRQMATSGARVQLGIAAAGTGKTTAMSVLTRAWTDAGGEVIGLAPSATAAAQLRGQTGARTDTIAKLITDLDTRTDSDLVDRIGPQTLVLIDEAGMADTLSLAQTVDHVIERGGSVRLIGDDQQLAAIGAGGVLRDVAAQHGAVRLAELMRFSDPAEGAASLAIRDGQAEGLGHYLDRRRVHIGDLATATDDVFTAWTADRAAGRDALMLAPTRDLVADLNARARTARLAQAGGPEGGLAVVEVGLADGNRASIGDTILTRRNDRRLRVSATDWVKNGDRWNVTAVNDGRITARHTTSGLQITLPAEYVVSNVELGYASTVHTAQGITADTVHGIVTGDESRQQLYTMLTRGRHENHVYLVAASDGDEHSLLRPETTHPRTAVDLLEQIVARDESPLSVTSLLRQADDPAAQLGPAVDRYVDSLTRGAELFAGADRVAAIEQIAEDLVPGIADEPAWPVLRAHLLLVDAQGRDAAADLTTAVTERHLDGVEDRAAILDWRLDPTGLRGAAKGPLPWLPAVPTTLTEDPIWGPYLAQRADRIESLAQHVAAAAVAADLPVWSRQGSARPADDVLAAVEVWRAATGVDPTDRRPTGRPQLQKAPAAYQRRLEEQLRGGREPALVEWGPLIDRVHPRRDAFTPLLAERLAAIHRSGIDAAALFHRAVAEGPLPDDHVTAALWWRISRHVSPTVATDQTSRDNGITADWAGLLLDRLGVEQAAAVEASPSWPTLAAAVDHAVERGWRIDELLDAATTLDLDDVDPAQAFLWRICLVTDPIPDETPIEFDDRPHDLDEVLTVDDHATYDVEDATSPGANDGYLELDTAARLIDRLEPLEQSSAMVARAADWTHASFTAPVTPDRVREINELTAHFYESRFQSSWAQSHLRLRLGHDLTGDPLFRPGYAPAGWTNLVDHLHTQGVSDDELLAAGVAKTASTGRLIDRFRDRAILPIIANETVIGFVGRRHPDARDNDPKTGPKYLNSPDTVVFHKGAQLYDPPRRVRRADSLEGSLSWHDPASTRPSCVSGLSVW